MTWPICSSATSDASCRAFRSSRRPSMTQQPEPRSPTERERREAMCRWLAYSGTPVFLKELLFDLPHSLVDQSLHSRLGVETTNGDGFGIGWYDETETPAVFRSVEPAWNDENLRELASHVRSRLVFAHIRASTGTPVQQTNCHPFRYGRWLWMHNGSIAHFHDVR